MANIHASALELIGNTPLVDLLRLCAQKGIPGRILAKLESYNPGGSAKDRVALSMITDAEEKGLLRPGSVIIEPTSGNTGIGLALVAALRGYRTIIVMPDSMSRERQLLMAAYGADLELTPGALGMQGAIDHAKKLAASIPGSIIAGQFDNPANPAAHYRATGPEIWRDTDGKVDFFVAGAGTGGTLTGVGRYLKEKDPGIRVIAAEPADSPLLSGGKAGPHGIQGIGANFIPQVLDTALLDSILPVTTQQAYEAARELGKYEGILAGISSGAALYAAMETARANPGRTTVVLLPDTGERYLSTDLFTTNGM